jgi:hypothetical protein
MLRKFFQKKQDSGPVVVPPPSQQEQVPSWEDRLHAAQGNDAALLSLAIEAPVIDIRLAAVNGISGEEALRTAEHEFRKRDRRVHSLAKQRYKLQVESRQTREYAAELIRTATVLLNEPVVAANRLAELSVAWGQLKQELVDDDAKAKFSGLQQSLAALVRERGEQKRAETRWAETASEALSALKAVCAEAGSSAVIDEDYVRRLALVRNRCGSIVSESPSADENRPEENGELITEIRSMLLESDSIASRIAMLVELRSAQKSSEAENDYETSKQHWPELPPVSDRRIRDALNSMFEEHLRIRQSEAGERKKADAEAVRKQDKAAKQARRESLSAQADELESQLAGGHLAEAAKLLAELQKASGSGYINTALQTRIGVLQAEFSRLKGWQHWGGGRAREDLVEESESLSASVTVVTEGDTKKTSVRQLERDIERLRNRWKELDRLGGATSKTLWERFDAALHAAYVPVAEHLAQLKAARQDNLGERNTLLAELNALQLPTDADDSEDWKGIARALAHFHTEWRKLGPVEHTTPRKVQTALLARQAASVGRLEAPLREVQGDAQTQRERLIAKARALIEDAHGRHTMAALRELQDQWQAQAKSLPLPRKVENTLWTEFRAAIDQLTGLRAAAIATRDAELQANQKAREALIDMLNALQQDMPVAEIRRVVAHAEQGWRSAGEPPRKNAAALEKRYRAARERALAHLDGSARRSWQRVCDAVLARVALCEAAESGITAPIAEDQQRDGSILPPAWERVLKQRCVQALDQGAALVPSHQEQLDQLLLQLESALDIPSPAEWQAERHALKLQAMKRALEDHTSATTTWLDVEAAVANVLGLVPFRDEQRARLRKIITALRDGNLRPR